MKHHNEIIKYNNEKNIISDKNKANILRAYQKGKKAMNSSHLFNVINKIQPNTSMNENRAMPTHLFPNEFNKNGDTSPHIPIGYNQQLDSDNKQLYSRNPKILPCDSVPSSKLYDDINKYESKLPIQYIDHGSETNKAKEYDVECTPIKHRNEISNYNNERNIFDKIEGNILRACNELLSPV